jgi:hypothetical protein
MADQAVAAATHLCQALLLMVKDFQVAHLREQA